MFCSTQVGTSLADTYQAWAESTSQVGTGSAKRSSLSRRIGTDDVIWRQPKIYPAFNLCDIDDDDADDADDDDDDGDGDDDDDDDDGDDDGDDEDDDEGGGGGEGERGIGGVSNELFLFWQNYLLLCWGVTDTLTNCLTVFSIVILTI